VSSAAADALVGQLLDGRYQVIERLAEGGMATVYLALDNRLDREVALKVMRQHLVHDETFVSRFRREARSAAQLSHPNIVQVFDQGEDAGQMFLAMEYVPGHTLREVITAEGALTPRAALDILEPILAALAAAHAAGLIHRDVKPENVILRPDGTVKVADFGLARAVTSQTSTASHGMILGTVAYLSPEQVERGIADARSDVYAVGLILFEMLTGSKAFTGDTPINVAYQHVHGGVPRPSSRNPDVPEQLDALVARATARDPDQRPRDAGEMLGLVRQVHAGLSGVALDARPTDAEGVHDHADARTAVLSVGDLAALADTQTHRTTALPIPALAPPHEAPPDGEVVARRKRWPWVLVVLSALLLAAVTWFFVGGPGTVETVPTLVGKTQTAAESALAQHHLHADVRLAFDETVRAGVVVSSDPGAGTQIRRAQAVVLVVSKGQERYAVPDVTGMSLDAAKAAVADSHLTVGSVTQAYSEQVADGLVIGADPKTGTRLKPGATITLVQSQGREPIDVVDWTGQNADAAVAALTKAGLKVDATKQDYSDTVPKGSVISQDPSSGTLFRGDLVTLVVSKGPVMVTVPDVVGQQVVQAKATLEAAGFKVKVKRVLGGFFGTVRLQDPAGGSSAPKGSTVTLTTV
jgi:serine/threonine-protein kinase